MTFEGIKRQIQSGYNFEYGKAAESYKRLKEQLQKQYQENIIELYQQKISAIEAQQLSEIIMDEIVSSPISIGEQRDVSLKLVNQIEEIVMSLFSPGEDGKRLLGEKRQKIIRKAAQSASQGIQEAKAAGAKYKGGTSKPLLERFQTALRQEQADALEIVNQALVRGGVLKDADEVNEVANTIKGYAYRVLIQKVTNRPKAKNPLFATIKKEPFIESLKGYYFELANENAINKIISKIQQQSNDGQSKKIVIGVGGRSNDKGQQSEIDLLFNTILNEQKILETFDKEYLGVAEVELDEFSSLELKNKAKNIYGAQVKSFDLQEPKGTFYKIGSRSNLLEKLYADGRYGSGFSQAGAIAFLGLKQNIMDALGKRNVLFIDGQSRYWMYDFINTFRKKNLYLTFEIVRQTRSNGTEEHSYKNIYRASAEVALYNYASAAYHRGESYMV